MRLPAPAPHPGRAPGIAQLLVFLAFLGQAAVDAVARAGDWYGWVPGTMSTFLDVTILGSPIAGAAGAWFGSSLRRAGMDEWARTSPRGIASVHRSALTAAFLPVAASYLVVFTVLLGATMRAHPVWPAGTWSTLLALPLAIAAAWFWAAVGVHAGRRLPAPVALAVAPVLAYASFVIPVTYLLDTPLLALPVTDGRPWTYGWLPPELDIAKTLLWVLLALLAGMAATERGKTRTARACAWAASAATALTLFVGAAWVDIPHASDRVCAAGNPQVCTDIAHATVLPSYQAMVTDALTVLPAALRPHRIDSTSTGPATVIAEPTRGDTRPSLVADRDDSLDLLGQAIFLHCSTPGAGDEQSRMALLAWWHARLSLHLPDTGYGAPLWLHTPEFADAPRLAERLLALTPARQTAWLEEHAEDILTCRLGEDAWPK